MEVPEGGYAFPLYWGMNPDHGMSLRQWYAGLAMQGLLASDTVEIDCKVLARASIEIADALIEAGLKPQ